MNHSIEFVATCSTPQDLSTLFTMVRNERLSMGAYRADGFNLGAALGFGYYMREDEMRDTDRFIFRYSKVANAGREYGELLADVVYEIDPYHLIELQNMLMSSIIFGLASAGYPDKFD